MRVVCDNCEKNPQYLICVMGHYVGVCWWHAAINPFRAFRSNASLKLWFWRRRNLYGAGWPLWSDVFQIPIRKNNKGGFR